MTTKDPWQFVMSNKKYCYPELSASSAHWSIAKAVIWSGVGELHFAKTELVLLRAQEVHTPLYGIVWLVPFWSWFSDA